MSEQSEQTYFGELYAFVAEDEGVIAGITPLGVTPLVFASREYADSVRQYVREVADISGSTIRYVRLMEAEVIETFKPHSENASEEKTQG